MSKSEYGYQTLVEVSDGESKEVHFSLRDDGVYIISRCNVLMGGEKIYMRSSVILSKEIALEMAKGIIEKLK